MIASRDSVLEVALESTPGHAAGTRRVTGPLSYLRNRGLLSTSSPAAGMFRIALVGDSMTFGAGVPYAQSLGPRLSVHLNGAVPERRIECLTFGIPGVCAYHAVGRVATQVLPGEPDVVVLCLCGNDAIMLAPQPDSHEAMGYSWITARPLLSTTLEAFRDEVRRVSSAQPLVLYLDCVRAFGNVQPPDLLASLCAELDLPFLDGSLALTGLPRTSLTVSPVDGHLNAHATDMVARQVAQFVLARSWVSSTNGYRDAAWIDAIGASADAQIAAGAFPASALAHTVAVLDAKWRHRRNTGRAAHDAHYRAVRQHLLDAHRQHLLALALADLGRRLRRDHPIAGIAWAEQSVNDIMAVSFALRHALRTRGDDDAMTALASRWRDLPRSTASRDELLAECQRLRSAAAATAKALAAIGTMDVAAAAAHSLDRQFLSFWTSRLAGWCQVVERCAAEYIDLLPRATPPHTVAVVSVLAFVDARITRLWSAIDAATSISNQAADLPRGVSRIAGAAALKIELVFSAPAGPDIWEVYLGVESYAPAYSERGVGCITLIRDGSPHRYELDLPITLSCDLVLSVSGRGMSDGATELRLHAARLRWAGVDGDSLELGAPQTTLVDDTLFLVHGNIETLPPAGGHRRA